MASSPERLRVAVFASGSGTNLQALLDHAVGDVPWRVELVVSDKVGARALDRGRAAGADAITIPAKDRDATEIAAETLAVLGEHRIDLILLAGYLRLVPAEVVAAYRGRILNVHPALLPSYGGPGMYGMRVHQAVIAAGCRVSGPSVHLVDEAYDRGRILAQWPVPVQPSDAPEDLAARVLLAEHRLYPRVVDHVCASIQRGEEPGPLPFDGSSFRIHQRKEER